MTTTDFHIAFRDALASVPAHRLAMRTSRRSVSPWRQGACLVLAEAVLAWLGPDNAELWVTDAGHAQHAFIRVGDLALDGGGVTPYDAFVTLWAKATGESEEKIRAGSSRVTVAQAETSGFEFDAWATTKLTALLKRAISRTNALEALR